LPSIDSSCDEDTESQGSKKRKQYLEHILRLKDHMLPKSTLLWKEETISENDFLTVLKRQCPKKPALSNQASRNPEDLELLAINLSKTLLHSPDWSFNTPKALSAIPEEDIIEVFI
jgi:hypothetical protein